VDGAKQGRVDKRQKQFHRLAFHRVATPKRAAIEPANRFVVRLRTVRSWSTYRPLLVIDGDSFAHRSYHALPKTIRGNDGKGAGAILGFANFLLRFYADERPRAVIVGWDSLDAPTKRHEMFPAYQSERVFDEELIEQLNLLPKFVAAFGVVNAKAPGFEADDFLAAAVAAEERAGGIAIVASGD
jgi:DNA polymerase-1